MVLVVSMTPVMYTDYRGYQAKLLETFLLSLTIVASATAVVIGVAVILGLSTLASPLIAVAMLTVGITNLMKIAVVGNAQYNKSMQDGDSAADVFSDVVDATGDYSMRKLLHPLGLIPVTSYFKEAGVEIYNVIGDLQFSGHGSKFTQITLKNGYAFAGATAGWVAGRTFVSMTDTDYCLDYATSLGWKPE